MVIQDAPPFGLDALEKSGIEEPEDLVGRKLGAPVFDASCKLFPAFASRVGIDPAAVPRVNMDPPLREAMLVRGEVDVISEHYFSSILDLQSKGVKADDIVVMLYKDCGLDLRQFRARLEQVPGGTAGGRAQVQRRDRPGDALGDGQP